MPPDTLKHQKQGTRQLAPEREYATETTVADGLCYVGRNDSCTPAKGYSPKLLPFEFFD